MLDQKALETASETLQELILERPQWPVTHIAEKVVDAYLAKLTSTKAEPSRIAYKEAGEKLTDAPTLVKLLALGDERAGKDLLQRVQVARDFLAQATDHIPAIEADRDTLQSDKDRMTKAAATLAKSSQAYLDYISLGTRTRYVTITDPGECYPPLQRKLNLAIAEVENLALSPPSTSQSEGEG